MKKKLSVITTMALMLITGLFMFAGCGSAQGQNLEDYMKDQSALRSSVDAQLSILSPDAKAASSTGKTTRLKSQCSTTR